MSWRRWIFGEPSSLLRELVDVARWRAAGEAERSLLLLDAALLVRGAGLEHLVQAPTRAEVDALAKAGELLGREQLLELLGGLANPAAAAAPLDGGAALRSAAMTAAKRAAGVA